LKDLTRREFLNVGSKESLKHLFDAWNGFQEGVKEKSRRSCKEVAKTFFKDRLLKTKQRKEGQN
jgi:hypothetical protein